MVDAVIREGEVSLNSVHFPIKGLVRREIVSRFADKITVGDDTYNNEKFLSNMIISDQRGGIGKEYGSLVDLTKCLWSTCDLDHEGHILPPPLATALTLPTLPTLTDGGLETWTTATDLTSWTETLNGAGAAVNREATTIHGGTYSAQLLTTAGYAEISATLSGWSNNFRGATVLITAWAKAAATTSTCTMSIYDGVGTTSVNITQDGVWNNNLCFRKLDVLATEITVKIRITWVSGTPVLYLDDIVFGGITDVNFCYANFNNGTYISKGSVLYRIDSATGAVFLQAMLPQKITSLKATVGTNLAIGQGDSYVWYYLTAAGGTLINGTGVATGAPITLPINRTTVTVTTAGTFTVTLPASGTGTATTGTGATVSGSPQALTGGANTVTITGTGTFTIDTFAVLTATDKTGAHFTEHWNDLFCYVNTSGQFYSTATLAASPTIATKGKIGDGSTINGLRVYHDTALADQVYCGTSNGVWVHDWTNAKWIKANIKFAAHPNAGKGLVNWNLGLYLSMGIHVKKYSITSGTASSESVGLDKDDGLPIKVASTGTNYFGEFTSFIEDNECFYGTMDSTQYGTNGYSWVAKYNGFGWQVLWTTTTLNQAMYGGIVGTVYTRRFYFDCGATLYSIPLPRVKILPKRISTYTYAASAVHITPWFNGGSQVNDKLAQAIKTFCKDITTTEKVTVSYRTNRTNTDLDTGWTELVILDTTAENNNIETVLASGVGVSCNLIQLRFDLVRSTSTNAPDLQSYSLAYKKDNDYRLGWSFIIDCTKTYNGLTPMELQAALDTIIAVKTLLPFNIRHPTQDTAWPKYVTLVPPAAGSTQTGRNFEGQYELMVIKP